MEGEWAAPGFDTLLKGTPALLRRCLLTPAHLRTENPQPPAQSPVDRATTAPTCVENGNNVLHHNLKKITKVEEK